MTEELDCGAGMQNEEELDADFDFLVYTQERNLGKAEDQTMILIFKF